MSAIISELKELRNKIAEIEELRNRIMRLEAILDKEEKKFTGEIPKNLLEVKLALTIPKSAITIAGELNNTRESVSSRLNQLQRMNEVAFMRRGKTKLWYKL